MRSAATLMLVGGSLAPKTVPVGLSAGAGFDRVMRALNYLEFEERVRGGMVTATRQQRKALETTDVEVVESPWRAGNPVQSLGTLFAGEGYFADYDVAHCNLVGPGSVAVARHAKRNDIPLILHAHVTKEDFAESFRGSTTLAPALEPYLRWFYSQADLVLCPSEYTKGVLESYPVDAPIRQMSNGVDVESLEGYEQFREETRERFDLDGMVVYAVGEVFERKGLTTFCELAQETDYDFAWFGPYDEGPQAGKATKRWVNDPPKNVTFTGYMEDKRAAFGAGDVYLFPAKVENQGIAVLEAMACGKPVVLRDIDVFREFFTDGEDCLMCSTHEEFRDALERLADDPELRERLGENARETAEAHSLDRVGDELEAVYESLVAGEIPVDDDGPASNEPSGDEPTANEATADDGEQEG
jgi:1,2-diacylglycerol-3-alpha-glucose alpha-1,2-glucosyltransferase